MNDDKGRRLTGADRAAVLLMTLGEDGAARVLKHMGPKEVQRLGTAMATLANVSQVQVDHVFKDFKEEFAGHTALGVDSESYIRRVLVAALGEEKAGSLVDRILLGGSAKGIETLKWMEPRAVADIMRLEHPQVMSIILCYLDRDHAAQVLAHLPERTRSDVLMRIATLDTVHPQALRELDEMLESQMSGASAGQSQDIGGVKTAAEILNYSESADGNLLDQIKDLDTDLGQRIEDLMFVFDNLAEVDDMGIQTLLREVSTDSLVVALKGTDEAMQEKFFRCMSKRAAEMLRDDLEAKGPVRVSEVEAAQREILGIARRLSEEGQLSLGGAGEEYV